MPTILPQCECCGKPDAMAKMALLKQGATAVHVASEFRPTIVCDDCRPLLSEMSQWWRAMKEAGAVPVSVRATDEEGGIEAVRPVTHGAAEGGTTGE